MPPAIERFSDCLRNQAAAFPDRIAVVFDILHWTYSELQQRVDDCARAMLACGINKGDRVATLSTPCPAYLVVYLATVRIGAIWIGLNPAQTMDEYRHLLADAKPALFFSLDRFRNRDNAEVLATIRKEFHDLKYLVVFGQPPSDCIDFQQFLSFGQHVSQRLLDARDSEVLPEDVAVLVYTSGSTGRPKGAMLTQKNIATGVGLYYWRWPVQPLRVICNFPISHIVCSIEIVAYTVYSGGTIVFQEYFDAEGFLGLIAQQQITLISILPTMFERILKLPNWDQFDTASLKVTIFGGAAMSSKMIKKLARLNNNVFALWGLTESTAAVTFTDPGDSTEILAQSIGRPGPGCEVAVMNGSVELSSDEVGEICIRGACVFAGYFGMPEASAATIDSNGWLRSGDLGRRDSEGRFYIVGRLKEMYKSGGYNVFPREVEAVIESDPRVSICAVVSVPDPTYQEVGVAFVIPAPGFDITTVELKALCREKLGNYKIPKQFIVRKTLPMLAIGKVDKVALRSEVLSQ